MELSQQEADRLREYLLRGGFWHVDDFWGLYQWDQFERQIKKDLSGPADRRFTPDTRSVSHVF